MLRAAESAFGTALFAKARKQKRDTSLDHRCVPLFVLPSFTAKEQQFLADITVAPPWILRYTLTLVTAAAWAAAQIAPRPKGGFCYEVSVSICTHPRVLFSG